MKILTSDIRINDKPFKNVVSVEISKTVEKLQDTAKIKVPATNFNDSLGIEGLVKRGDTVTISLGYDKTNVQEFSGYVTSVSVNETIVINCEDGIFKWRNPLKNKEYLSKNVVEIVNDFATRIGVFKVVAGKGVDAMVFSKFTVVDSDGRDALQKIKDQTKLNIYVRGNELHLALPYSEKRGEVVYDFSKNIEKSSLKWLKADERKVLVNVVSMNKKGEKITVSVGDKGGDEITHNVFNITNKKALETIGKNEVKKWRIDGYEGTITGWLQPFCTYGFHAKIIDKDYRARAGVYFVEGVNISYSESGGVRKITLGKKIR